MACSSGNHGGLHVHQQDSKLCGSGDGAMDADQAEPSDAGTVLDLQHQHLDQVLDVACSSSSHGGLHQQDSKWCGSNDGTMDADQAGPSDADAVLDLQQQHFDQVLDVACSSSSSHGGLRVHQQDGTLCGSNNGNMDADQAEPSDTGTVLDLSRSTDHLVPTPVQLNCLRAGQKLEALVKMIR